MLPFFGQQWWQQSANTSNDLNEVYATNDLKAYTFGDSTDIFGGFATGTQFVTTNQGAVWTYQDMGSPIYRVEEACFLTDNLGYLVGKNQLSGNGFVIKTTDGGANWTEGLPHVERLEGVSFGDNMVGYACGRNDYVTRTIDGGVTWTDVSANTGDRLHDVFFTTPANGYVVGKNGVIAHTTDSASTWNNQNSNTGQDLIAVHFINDSTGWACGKSGKMIFTNDYGNTWVTQSTGTNEDLLDMEFVNDTTGWAVGTAGKVIKTVDAGNTWINETSGTTEDIFSISMRNDQLGWFCGTNGALYVYAVMQPNAVPEYLKPENVLIAPNPFDQSTTVYFDGQLSPQSQMEIIDISGKIVRRVALSTYQSQYIIDRGQLHSGIYFLRITDKGSSVTLRLVIN